MSSRRRCLSGLMGLCSAANSNLVGLLGLPGLIGLPGLTGLWPAASRARELDPVQAEMVRQARLAMDELLAGRVIANGQVWLDIPPLVENGNSVAAQVRVSDIGRDPHHVERIHLIAEGNPSPRILTAHFTASSARPALLSTRIRLANTQRVWALVEWSDGRVWAGHADSIVTLSSCTEER